MHHTNVSQNYCWYNITLNTSNKHLIYYLHPAFRVLNAFYFQTDFNLRFKRKRDVRLTCKRV